MSSSPALDDLHAISAALTVRVDASLQDGQTTADLLSGASATQDAYDSRNRDAGATASAHVEEQEFGVRTDLLAQLNESWNANRYILNTVGAEAKRIAQLDTQTKRDLHIVRQQQMHTSFSTHFYRFAAGVVGFTTIITLGVLAAVAMMRAGVMSPHAATAMGAGVVLLYIVVMTVLFRGVASRRPSWTQVYWPANDTVRQVSTG